MHPDILESEALEDNNKAGRFDGIPLSEWEPEYLLDTIGTHDESYVVTASWDGEDLSGIGLYSCGELQSVEDIEVER